MAQKFIFVLAPIITVVPAVIVAAVVPWGTSINLFGREITLYIADISVGILYITAITSIAVYGISLAGWSSYNKYALMGGLRSTAQMISYELTLGLGFVIVVIMAGSLRAIDIVEAQRDIWFVFVQPVGALVLFIGVLAELNRAPFDMPEAEQELAAGYHSEYSGMKFALFFMAEYTKMITISAIVAMLFLGGYLGPFVDEFPILGPVYMIAKVVFLLFLMVWVRATLPRIRYDRLMSFGWKILLPLSLALALITAGGELLAHDVNPAWRAIIPVLSIAVGYLFLLALGRSLRRKEYA
jgi:NADH-quinone oxidoreductase subunit H